MSAVAELQGVRAEMAEAERLYLAAHKNGDDVEVQAQRRRYHGLRIKVPALEVQARDEAAAEARRIGEARRPDAERWAKAVAKKLGELHELVTEGRPLFNTTEAERLSDGTDHDRLVHNFRAGIGWLDGIRPVVTSYVGWLKRAAEAGTIKLPKSVERDPLT